MDLNKEIKKFNDGVKAYAVTRTDPAELHRFLELASTADLDVYKPGSANAPNFYVYLHDLLTHLEPQSTLLWPAITVVQKACHNNKTREALIHTYKYIPVVSRFLDINLSSEKLLILLNVLSELTFGVKITWQEAHLPQLIATLVQIITGSNKTLVAPALTTLVNLCYKNVQPMYILVRKVEIKSFMKLLTSIRGNWAIQLQACKMLMILTDVKGVMPKEDILHFVDVSFHCATEAFKMQDDVTLRHVVHFFKDTFNKPQIRPLIATYPKMIEDTKRLLELIKNSEVSENQKTQNCVATLLDIFPTIFNIKNKKMNKLLPFLITTISPWIQNTRTRTPALNIFLLIPEILQSEQQDDVLPLLADIVGMLMELLESERTETLPDVLSLLTELSLLSSSLREQVLSTINHNQVDAFFNNLFSDNFFYKNCLSEEDTSNEFCIQLITFISTLSASSEKWMEYYQSLIGRKEIQWSIAVAILNGNPKIKCRALRLITTPSWGKDALSELCQIMTETRKGFSMNEDEAVQRESCASIFTSEHRINELLENIQRGDSGTSSFMELYEYKLSAMSQSERQLEAALEASDKRCIGLNHQVVQLRSQVAMLHQSLFDTQNAVEGRTAEKTDLMKQLDKLRAQSAEEKKTATRKIDQLNITSNELRMRLQHQEDEIKIRDERLAEQHVKLTEVTHAYETTCIERDDCQNKLSEAIVEIAEQMKMLENAEKELAEQREELKECHEKIEEFELQNTELKDSINDLMEQNNQKDKMLLECEKNILRLENIREAVINVARMEKL